MSLVVGILLPEGIALACDGRVVCQNSSKGEGDQEPGFEVVGNNCPKIHLISDRHILAYTGYAEINRWNLDRDTIPWLKGLMADGATIREAGTMLSERLANVFCGRHEKTHCFVLCGYDKDKKFPYLIRYAYDEQFTVELGIQEDDMLQGGIFCMGHGDILKKVIDGEEPDIKNLGLDSALNLVELLVVLEIKCRPAFKGHKEYVGGRLFTAAATQKQCGFVRRASDGRYRFIDNPVINPFQDFIKEAQKAQGEVEEALKAGKNK